MIQNHAFLNLEAHHLALAIAKKTLDENHSRTAQKSMDRETSILQNRQQSPFQKQTTRKMGSQAGDLDTGLFILSMQWTLPTHWKSSYWKNKVVQHQGHVVLEPPVEFWNINTQFSRAGKCIHHPANLPTIMLNNWRWNTLLMYIVTCK